MHNLQAFLLVTAGVAAVGCRSTGDVKDASYAEWGRLERLAVAEPVLCTGRTVEGQLALDALKSQVAVTAGEWTAGRPDCDALAKAGALDAADLSAPALDDLALAKQKSADAVLVTVVSFDEKCTTPPGAAPCEASGMTLGAFLYDAQGRMVWKSVTSRPLGYGMPAPSAEEPRELLYSRPRHPEEHVVAEGDPSS
ncbi:MAG: hypothetical protein HOV80_26115 [Polyangiaceae bacterium]|nr:hypothetical protein [Polyangiaceae bacterium]